MIDLLTYHLDTTDWTTLRAMAPDGAGHIPHAVRSLVSARSVAEADSAYWQLDNQVVVQGQLFEAAAPLVPVLLAALTGHLEPVARVRFADLLVEITCGGPDESESTLGNSDLGRVCRRAAGTGIWLFYKMLLGHDAALRERALQIIYAVDEDRSRVAAVLADLRTQDPVGSVRDAAAELSGYMPSVIYDDDVSG